MNPISKDSIISEVAKNKGYISICKRLVKNPEYYMDLFQEMILVLLEYPEEKIIGIYQRNELRWFIVRIIMNLNSQRGNFHKKYYHKDIYNQQDMDLYQADFVDIYEEQAKSHNEIRDLNIIKEEIKKSHWYPKELFRMYNQSGSYRSVANETGIPFSSVYQAVTKFKESIIEKVNGKV